MEEHRSVRERFRELEEWAETLAEALHLDESTDPVGYPMLERLLGGAGSQGGEGEFLGASGPGPSGEHPAGTLPPPDGNGRGRREIWESRAGNESV